MLLVLPALGTLGAVLGRVILNLLGAGVAPRFGELLRHDVALGAAQRGGLRLAAAFGHRFGEVGEQHGKPQPDRHGQDKSGRRLALPAERLNVKYRRE